MVGASSAMHAACGRAAALDNFHSQLISGHAEGKAQDHDFMLQQGLEDYVGVGLT
jgi:hypothetical protein